MANDFYTHGSAPGQRATLSSAVIRSELDLITTGFAKLPTLASNGSKAVVVNAGATALTVTTGTLALGGNLSTAAAFTTSGAFALTLTVTGTTNVTLPTSGTLASGTLTNHAVLIGTGTAIASTAVGGANTFLAGVGGADPTFRAIDVSTADVTGTLPTGRGGTGSTATAYCSLTANVSGILPTANGGTGIAYFTAAGPTVARTFTFPDANCTVLTTNAAITVAQGGTGVGSATAYAVLCGGTTSTSPFQSIASVGTSGQVLTSNGAGALPTFQTVSTPSGTFTKGTALEVTGWASSTKYTQAHGLGVVPTMAYRELVCTTAELNYSVGDVAFIDPNPFNNDGIHVVCDATNVYVLTGTDSRIWILDKTTPGTAAAATAANWKIRATPYKHTA